MRTFTIDDQLVFIDNSFLEISKDVQSYDKILALDLGWELHISEGGMGAYDIQLILRISSNSEEQNAFVKYVTDETILVDVDYQFKMLYLRNMVAKKFVQIPWSLSLRKWTLQILFSIIDNKLISSSFLLRMFSNIFNESVFQISSCYKKGVLNTSFELEECYERIFSLEEDLFKKLGGKYPGSGHYAKLLSTNKANLLKEFTYCTNLGILEYFSSLRIELSKRLLKMGASVKEVVFLMEFKSISYYNYSFKKKTGVTPVDFKKLYIE